MNILALVESESHVCCRYRLAAFAPVLAARGASLVVRPLARRLAARTRQLFAARAFDAVVLQRRLLPTWQWDLLRACARRLVFDFDDAVFHRDSYHRRGIECRRLRARFVRVARDADVLLAGNPFLAEAARGAGAAPGAVRWMPTCLETAAYPLAGHLCNRPDGLRGVWIGSSSTLRGLEQSRPLWRDLGARLPGVRLRLISDRFASLAPLRTEPVPWSQSREARDLADCDFGLAWMPDDAWSRGKCGLKVLQYQAAGLPVVANRVGVHALLVEHGVSGFLADTSEEWTAAVTALADPELRRAMGAAGRRSVETTYSVATWGERFAACVTGRDAMPLARAVDAGRAGIAAPHALNPARRGAEMMEGR